MTSFEKILSASDIGRTGGHMGGVLIPRTELGLIALFPTLSPLQYNPSIFLNFKAPNNLVYKVRFIYYNNKIHGKGTRNEYRLTCLTVFLRNSNADIGDGFRISRDENGTFYMEVKKHQEEPLSPIIKLVGWNRVC
jgi:hypothetical protein